MGPGRQSLDPGRGGAGLGPVDLVPHSRLCAWGKGSP